MKITRERFTLAVSIFFFISACVLFFFTNTIRDIGGGPFYMASSFMPKVTLIGVAVAAMAIAVESVSNYKSRTEMEFPLGFITKMLLGMIIYAFSLPHLGYIITTFTFVVYGSWVMGEKRYVVCLLNSALFVAVGYAIFVVSLRVSVPAFWW